MIINKTDRLGFYKIKTVLLKNCFPCRTCLDAYSKKWRLYADTLNDAAMCIEIALPYFKNYTTVVLCVSTVMKAIVGVSGEDNLQTHVSIFIEMSS